MRGVGRLASLLRRTANVLQPSEPHVPLVLNETRKAFVDWNAARLGITPEECLRRYQQSWNFLPGGHAGNSFRNWDITLGEIARVLVDDSPNEVYSAYGAIAPITLLRLLSYEEPSWSESDSLFRDLVERRTVDILDFGCGLAQNSRALAIALSARGITTSLALADIHTFITDFLMYLSKRQDIAVRFLACSPKEPIPELPACDVLFAQEFFEHVYDPVSYLNTLHRVLRPNGFLVTNVADHHKEMLHVHPDLSSVRARIAELGYEAVLTDVLFRKP